MYGNGSNIVVVSLRSGSIVANIAVDDRYGDDNVSDSKYMQYYRIQHKELTQYIVYNAYDIIVINRTAAHASHTVIHVYMHTTYTITSIAVTHNHTALLIILNTTLSQP